MITPSFEVIYVFRITKINDCEDKNAYNSVNV